MFISTSPLFLLSTSTSSTPPRSLTTIITDKPANDYDDEQWCGLRFLILQLDANDQACYMDVWTRVWERAFLSAPPKCVLLFSPQNPGRPPPRAASVSWDGSLTDRQADGSDTSDISGIQQNNVDGNQWRQWQQGRERLEEKTGGRKWVERKAGRQGREL